MAVTAMAASAGNSPYIARVYDYLPAPGQFVNQSPAYKPGYTQDSINAIVEASLRGKATGGPVSLGSYGGYIVFGFDHPVINKHGYDVKIYGNAMQSAAVPDMAGGSCEPGIIMVGVDMDGNGVPSDGDKWYEIKGADYDRCQHGFEVTYYKPDENKTHSSTIWSMSIGRATMPMPPVAMCGATRSTASLIGRCGSRTRCLPSEAHGCPILLLI